MGKCKNKIINYSYTTLSITSGPIHCDVSRDLSTCTRSNGAQVVILFGKFSGKIFGIQQTF